MGFTKTTQAEKTEVLSPAQHKAAEDALKRLGQPSAQGLSKSARAALSDSIDSAQ